MPPCSEIEAIDGSLVGPSQRAPAPAGPTMDARALRPLAAMDAPPLAPTAEAHSPAAAEWPQPLPADQILASLPVFHRIG